MTWKYETVAQYYARVGEWHKWFAWYPIYVGGTAYWLCTIECKFTLVILDLGYWDYRGPIS